MNKFNVKYILIVISINFIFSAYLKNIAISLNQPDGTLINCFTSGDEFYHYLHDENDFTIIQNKEDGYYYYAVRWNDSIIPSDYLVNEVNPNSVGIEKNILISKNQYLEKLV